MTPGAELHGQRPALVLASVSPRRLALLAQIGVVPDAVIDAAISEDPRPGEVPRALCVRLAEEKARRVFDSADVERRKPHVLVLGADTVVACGRRVLPKPETPRDQRRCLELLSGRRHRVLTGLALIDGTGRCRTRIVETQVAFKRLTERDIDRYVNSAEGYGKAGGYAIQGRAGRFVRFIGGSYTNVVGLPLYETANLLAGAGYVLD